MSSDQLSRKQAELHQEENKRKKLQEELDALIEQWGYTANRAERLQLERQQEALQKDIDKRDDKIANLRQEIARISAGARDSGNDQPPVVSSPSGVSSRLQPPNQNTETMWLNINIGFAGVALLLLGGIIVLGPYDIDGEAAAAMLGVYAIFISGVLWLRPNWKSSPISAALLAALIVGVGAAWLIGASNDDNPDPTSEPAVTQVADATVEAQITADIPTATVELSTNTPSPPSPTPTAAATSTPAVPVGVMNFTIIFEGEDALTVLVNEDSNLSDVVILMGENEERISQSFSAFAAFGNVVPASTCLRYERVEANAPVPRDCQNAAAYFEESMSVSDVFWYNEPGASVYDAIIRVGGEQVICSSAAGRCEVVVGR